jgi:outer membrane protein OmpA-like peptidoglycan-associated protein
MKKILFWLLFFGLFSNNSYSQRSHLEEGDEYFHKRYYREAIQEYELALQEKIVVKKYYMTERVAKTYFMLFDYENALTWYQKLVEFKEENAAENIITLARIQMNLEQYTEAKINFKLYSERINDSTKANEYNRWCDWAIQNKDSVYKYNVHKTEIETGSRSMGIAYYQNGLVFSKPQIQDYKTKTAFYDLAYLKCIDSIKFDSALTLKGEQLNRSFYEGTPCFSVDGKTLYYTGNSTTSTKYRDKKADKLNLSKDGINILKIFSSTLTNDTWSAPVELGINSNQFDCVFPFLANDQKTLYFASNRPGGFGGYDLYKSTSSGNNVWSIPENLGSKVNSSFDEMYPYILNDTLYFSSKGHDGFGGADIYFSKLENGKANGIQNLGKPFNSSKDDFSLIGKREDGLFTGYFSSNREGTHGYDHIYFFRQHKKPLLQDTIIGVAKNKITLVPIKDVKIVLYKKEENDSTIASEQTTPSTGSVELILDKKTEYTVTFEAPGFQKKTVEIPAENRENVLALFGDLQLDPVIEKNSIIQIRNIYFDFDKATIREESFKILAQIIIFLNENPNIRVELSAHTDARGSDAYNLKLSQKRAESTVNYLVERGIDPARLVPKGYGEKKIQNQCKNGVKCSEEEHEMNRRVELKVL